ncbi:cobalt ABC transporter ATPase [Halogeometricum borinquense DSM 11551]|uniref:ABC-type cobalt transport system, ATPase component n=1 Tax=Halogeometricum borinquense (strain ATCC 700274 / DSM 11551 / JCM 10706 / KCTC 4070 / PR3) TaxID=469382 RepID=E4NRK6_HALBP|nr:ABC transporter ATP-binding protein [Halogeometricum borinquense]ADQ65682.1 ABC-type cobalt transport system, ATPase component [Halogeometricum borinquense DSM 11551]ELY27012.1 cobalt ABC transporter ATPase [Halogeometricum borinquense DSM 11551]
MTISTDSLTHRYGDTVAIDEVSLEIEAGEFVVLAGANGSGKTTLVRHFNGLLEPDTGDIAVNGQPVSENPVAARTAVGMVFQDPRDQFVAATVGADVAFGPENLGLPRAEIDDRVADALDAVNLRGRRNERIDELSGGEQERVAIAGALAMHPDHLVLDEPFTGLDAPARNAVMDRLTALHGNGTSIVVVTHDLRDVQTLADRVVVLSDGRVVVDETPEQAVEQVEQYDVRAPE